jgi:hypothetical protein
MIVTMAVAPMLLNRFGTKTYQVFVLVHSLAGSFVVKSVNSN